jgi:ligand-binding SRPBCC domain-containing protein
MNITIETPVEQGYLEVKAGFTETLFKKLAPPFPPVNVIRFDGCNTGDEVALELNFILFKQKWVSLITADQTSEKEFFFVDEGTRLPFFLGKWKHKHRIISSGKGAVIRDEIDFEGPFAWMTPLLYPVLWLQFWYRKPIYRKIFKKPVLR